MGGRNLPGGYGEGMGDWSSDPRLRKALERMAETDADPKLRAMVARIRGTELGQYPARQETSGGDGGTGLPGPMGVAASTLRSMTMSAEPAPGWRERNTISTETGEPMAPPPEGPFARGMSALGDAVKTGAQHVGNFLVPEWVPPVKPEAPAPASGAPPPTAPAPAPAPMAARRASPVPPVPVRPRPPVSVRPATPTPTRSPTPVPINAPPLDAPVQTATVAPAGSTSPAGPGSDFEQALAAARGSRLIGDMTAIGRGDFRSVSQRGDQPLEDLALERGETQAELQRASAAADADPASPQSQAARAILQQVLGPQVSRAPWFTSMTYARAASGPMGKLISESADVQRARLTAQAQVDAARAKARGGAGGAREADVQKLGKDTEGLAQVSQDLGLLEEVTSGGGDIPGAGMWDSSGLKPAWMQSTADIDVRQATSRVAARLLHEQSGASVTPSEAERFLEGRGMGKGATEAQFRAGVKALAAELRAVLQAKQAKYRPEVLSTLRQRGGFTADQLGGGARQPAPPRPGMVRIRDPRTGRTGWAKPDRVPPGAEVIPGA